VHPDHQATDVASPFLGPKCEFIGADEGGRINQTRS
jgi:hypothetical protein